MITGKSFLLDSLDSLVVSFLVDENQQVAAIGSFAANGITDTGPFTINLAFGDRGGDGGFFLHIVELVIHFSLLV